MGTANILIVDDDARNIFALVATLKARGYNCLSASGAKEALLMMRDDPSIDLVLMDMMMPEMDGYEAIPLIREQFETPVIAVTAQAMKGDREKCLAVGANAYVAKPIDVDRLLLLLSTILNSSR